MKNQYCAIKSRFDKKLSPGVIFAVLLTMSGLVQPAQAADPKDAGISLGSTRVIYNEKSGAAAIRIINTSSIPFLVQTWVDNYQGAGGWEKTSVLAPGTFVATPPLFRLDKGENSVRIQRASGNLPADRESVFQLKVKTIPSASKPTPGTSYVQFAFVNAVKLFWRPVGLTGKPDDAYKSLTFKRQGDKIEAVNPTPYHITLKKLSVGGVAIKDPDSRMVPPLSSQTWPLPAGAGGKVTFEAINDYGALTPPLTVSF
ncbi:molecular chaperone [Enterobacter mori]|uniref:fimbrial biogenesis chaperone n=1 Tax=Enterobacter mori TaxID=539813 RepID=UPI003B8414B4